jgi:hypothetical protein
MDVFLQSISKRTKTGVVDLSIVFGSEAAIDCRAICEVTSHTFTIEPREIALRLQNLSRERYRGNPIKYLLELSRIVGAIIGGYPIPEFPVKLGTTHFFQRDQLSEQGDANDA